MTRSPLVVAVADGGSSAVPGCVEDATTLCAKDRTATGAVPTILRPLRNRVQPDNDGVEQLAERRTQRAEAIGSVLRSFASIVILGIAVVLVLGELGNNLAPIVAGAGVVGLWPPAGSRRELASGGGQGVLSHYGVGDVVDLGEASGTVQAVGLRITRLRDVNGVVWYVRNGEVLRVGNDMRILVTEMAGRASIELKGRELRMRLKERFVAEGFRTPLPLLSTATGTPTVSR